MGFSWDSGKPKVFLQLDFNCFGWCAEFMALKPAALVFFRYKSQQEQQNDTKFVSCTHEQSPKVHGKTGLEKNIMDWKNQLWIVYPLMFQCFKSSRSSRGCYGKPATIRIPVLARNEPHLRCTRNSPDGSRDLRPPEVPASSSDKHTVLPCGKLT